MMYVCTRNLGELRGPSDYLSEVRKLLPVL